MSSGRRLVIVPCSGIGKTLGAATVGLSLPSPNATRRKGRLPRVRAAAAFPFKTWR